MNRAALRIILEVVLTIVLGIALITAVLLFVTGNVVDSAGESARLMFLFMDVGLVVWVLLTIVLAVRSRGARPGVGLTLLFALVGAIVNLLVVIVVGLIQTGSVPSDFVLFATEAGIAFFVAALIVVPIVHAAVKPRATVDARP